MTMQALTTSSRSVTLFSPDKLRKALLSAGNIVKPEEVSAVLSYVTSDGEYEDLNGLHLILLNDGSLQQLLWGGRGGNKYFVFTDAKSERIYKLMEGNKHQLVKSCSAWDALSRWPLVRPSQCSDLRLVSDMPSRPARPLCIMQLTGSETCLTERECTQLHNASCCILACLQNVFLLVNGGS